MDYTFKSAVMPADERYRYELWRGWGLSTYLSRVPAYIMFVGLNPSTADAELDDATIRRCVDFAARLDYTRIVMTNLFGFRATQPDDMMLVSDPIGPKNDEHLLALAKNAHRVMACWGAHGTYLGRDEIVTNLLPRMLCLGLTKHGHPKHPLRLSKHILPIWYKAGTLQTSLGRDRAG